MRHVESVDGCGGSHGAPLTSARESGPSVVGTVNLVAIRLARIVPFVGSSLGWTSGIVI